MKYLTISLLTICAFSALAEKPKIEPKPEREKPQISRPSGKSFPAHWGRPPAIQTKDLVKLPANFGKGSSTLARWITENLKEDAKKEEGKPVKPVKPVDGKKPKPIPPIQPILPEPPKEIKKKIELHKKIQDSLRKGLKQKIDALGEGATKEDIKKVVEAYRNENAERIEDATHIGKQIQEWQKENRPKRPKRPEPSEEIREKAAKVRLVKNDLDIARKALGQELKGKSKEASAELIKAFRESQKELYEELKDAKQDLLKEVRKQRQTGDRRE